jgi:putative PIN family toxin of toxin-antitoxin system
VSGQNHPGAVFDCVIYLQAAAGPTGPAARLLSKFLETGRFTLYVTDHMLGEVKEVLERPTVRQKNRNVTDETTGELLERLGRLALRVTDVPRTFVFAHDPDDEPYLDLALAVHAEYLVTRDKHWLDLMHEAGFRAQYPQVTILDPVAFLRILMAVPE